MALLAGVGFAQVLLVNEPMLAGRLASLKKRLFRPLPVFRYTGFLLLSRVSHVDGFFSRAEALWFDLVSFVCFRFSCQIQKIITKIYVEGIATYVFVWKFYGFGPSVQV